MLRTDLSNKGRGSMTDVVVLLSGGIDSAVVLALSVRAGQAVEALTVNYGQRHGREIDAATRLAHYYDVGHTIVSVDRNLFAGSALTFGADVPDTVAHVPDATYVPARNTVLLALAAARAEAVGARTIAFGANGDDAGGYPDCRPAYIEALRDVLNEGTVGHVWLRAPLLHMSKVEVVNLARKLDVPLDLTWSCYQGGLKPCGACGACTLRHEALA